MRGQTQNSAPRIEFELRLKKRFAYRYLRLREVACVQTQQTQFAFGKNEIKLRFEFLSTLKHLDSVRRANSANSTPKGGEFAAFRPSASAAHAPKTLGMQNYNDVRYIKILIA